MWPAVIGLIAGAVSGVGAAVVQGHFERAKVREEYAGQLAILKETWAQQEKERNADAGAAQKEGELKQLTDLRAAASSLAQALRDPNATAYERRLNEANSKIASATSNITIDGQLSELSRRLHEANSNRDAGAANAVLLDLQRFELPDHGEP